MKLHSIQHTRHTGTLDEGEKCEVHHEVILAMGGYTRGVEIDKGFEKVGLTPAQALSLMEWLIQEEEVLRKRAKEQG